jgi:hypothetical protein
MGAAMITPSVCTGKQVSDDMLMPLTVMMTVTPSAMLPSGNSSGCPALVTCIKATPLDRKPVTKSCAGTKPKAVEAAAVASLSVHEEHNIALKTSLHRSPRALDAALALTVHTWDVVQCYCYSHNRPKGGVG